jgi:hypothetical protein
LPIAEPRPAHAPPLAELCAYTEAFFGVPVAVLPAAMVTRATSTPSSAPGAFARDSSAPLVWTWPAPHYRGCRTRAPAPDAPRERGTSGEASVRMSCGGGGPSSPAPRWPDESGATKKVAPVGYAREEGSGSGGGADETVTDKPRADTGSGKAPSTRGGKAAAFTTPHSAAAAHGTGQPPVAPSPISPQRERMRGRLERDTGRFQLHVDDVLRVMASLIPSVSERRVEPAIAGDSNVRPLGDACLVVGVTMCDLLSAPSDLFVAGMAAGGSRVAVFSFHRRVSCNRFCRCYGRS